MWPKVGKCFPWQKWQSKSNKNKNLGEKKYTFFIKNIGSQTRP